MSDSAANAELTRSLPRWVWLVMGLLAAMVGCAKAPPVPVDQFYRLPVPVAVSGDALGGRVVSSWGDVVVVSAIRSNGLHTERAVVYSEAANALTLKRYHYHHWVDGPPRLFRDYLIGRLRASVPESLVLRDHDARADVLVAGRIKQFEHHVPEGDGHGQVLVAIELRVSAGSARTVRMLKDYRASVAVRGPGMGATVDAFGEAVAEISASFVRDVNANINGWKL